MTDTEKVFVVDDDTEHLEYVSMLLSQQGYQVVSASSAREALQQIARNPPDLLICDVEMPQMDGLELVRKVGEDLLLRNIPVILMSGKRISSEDLVKGLGIGSDDYILKPFTASVLLARVKAVLRRTEQGLDANPLTHLPGNSSILREIDRRLTQKTPFGVLYADLNHFKAFNDRYGFLKGDEVIQFTARVLLRSLQEVSRGADFLGHVGGDDFILVTLPERVVPLCEFIIKEFDAGIQAFYSEEDRRAGQLKTLDRQGKPQTYPLMGIGIGVVTSQHRVLHLIGEVSQIGAEMKKHAKEGKGSRYVIDRRGDNRPPAAL